MDRQTAVFQQALMGVTAGAAGVPVIYDYEGQVSDLAWLTAMFGPGVAWERATSSEYPNSPYIYRLVTLRAKCGPAALIARVIDQNGQPIERAAVIRYWPGAPELPDFSGYTKQWTARGVVGRTNANGDVGYGLGPGDYYDPGHGESGASGLYPAEVDGPADYLGGLGMLGGTEHCHIDATWQRLPADTDPDPDPDPDPEPGPGGWVLDLRLTGTVNPGEK